MMQICYQTLFVQDQLLGAMPSARFLAVASISCIFMRPDLTGVDTHTHTSLTPVFSLSEFRKMKNQLFQPVRILNKSYSLQTTGILAVQPEITLEGVQGGSETSNVVLRWRWQS